MLTLVLTLACTKSRPSTDDSGAGDSADPIVDADGDGFSVDEDCDDDDPAVNPDAAETCNDLDDNCDGSVDEGVLTWFYVDADGDGFGSTDKIEACETGDGVVEDSSDCNDDDASINTDATEVCDGVDNDCDSLTDSDDDSVDLSTVTTWYTDSDGDGFGDATDSTDACDPPSGTVENAEDCDDALAEVNPDADELCNELDDDCDGDTDEDDALDAVTWYADSDSDGYGDADSSWVKCEAPPETVEDDTDCDDTDDTVFPGADEVCDGVDNDCEGDIDEDAIDATTWYLDDDGDGYGDASTSQSDCDQPSDHVSDATDCDDTDADTHPGADEYCDGHDDDCDGDTDEDDAIDATLYYQDNDGDSYGTGTTTKSCSLPSGYATVDGDCDDSDADVNPGETEICDGSDNDCDSSTSEDDMATWIGSGGSVDFSSSVTGTSSSPASTTLSSTGDLVFCDGTFYVNLDIEADVDVYSQNADRTTTILDGAGSGTVIDIDGGYDVTLSDLTIQNGYADRSDFLSGSYTGGGGVGCTGDGSNTVTGTDLFLDDNYGQLGGNLSFEDCSLDFTDVEITGGSGSYGGAGFLNGADFVFDGANVHDNTGSSYGTFWFYDYAYGEILDSALSDNSDTSYGTIRVYNSDLYVDGSSFTDNSTTGSSGEVFNCTDSVSTLEVVDSDLGTLSGGDDNSGDVDISWYYDDYEAGDGVSLSCDYSNGCGTDATTTFGSTSSSTTYYGYGNIFLATDDGSLEDFSAYLRDTSSCDPTFYVLANTAMSSSGWTVEWVGSSVSVGSTAAYYDSGTVNIAIESGRYYALLPATTCSSGLYFYYNISSGSTDPDWGTSQGYVYATSALSGAVGDTVSVYASSSYGSIFAHQVSYTTY